MKIIVGIWIGLACLYVGVAAQGKYEKHSAPQQVKYDDEDEEPTYRHLKLNSGAESNSYGEHHKQPDEAHYYKPASSPYPQPDHFQQTHAYRIIPSEDQYLNLKKLEPEYQVPHPQSLKPRAPQYEQSDELQYSHGPEQSAHHHPIVPKVPHASPVYYQPVAPEVPRVSPVYHQSATPQISHASRIYHQQGAPESPKAVPRYHQPAIQESAGYQQPEAAVSSGYRQPATPVSSEYHQPAAPESSGYHQPAAPESTGQHKSEVPKTPPNSLVVRDPKLPLYFTMYEKRIIQDPVDKYGKGPWRYLTYGHGITYGSKEPGKVFERGYGYIRALGRDHCKLPGNRCPQKDDDKPFEYEGRKEPYFGYRPH
ncbi:uncharacterized protein TNIN_108011 [Trichonephila inaurata madagascariensis]|uniref:Uncharacterized protein n=1 Tax=Trichonephila inaurata madagascariensis TaxID=2747483 RepID=A0A8X6YSD5_9ARAC|nr:uncharacterized protein TNIN_108011 [Trichonephila inaurata madagascariensis]